MSGQPETGQQPDEPRYTLRLFVTGATPHSMRAVQNINKICDHYLKGRFDLEIIDVYQQPELAVAEQIIAAPTLIKVTPHPTRRLIGDLSNIGKVVGALGLEQQGEDKVY
ncbi:MAG TPA: circadian clock KaiB family protein [Candidatus Saccharimonadales bacterium]|jgi:circadian clock protein KaiB